MGVKFGRTTSSSALKNRRTVFRRAAKARSFAPDSLARARSRRTVADITRLYAFDRNDAAGMRRALGAKALPESWRSHFRDRIGREVH
jgi:hypothetical protein